MSFCFPFPIKYRLRKLFPKKRTACCSWPHYLKDLANRWVNLPCYLPIYFSFSVVSRLTYISHRLKKLFPHKRSASVVSWPHPLKDLDEPQQTANRWVNLPCSPSLSLSVDSPSSSHSLQTGGFDDPFGSLFTILLTRSASSSLTV